MLPSALLQGQVEQTMGQCMHENRTIEHPSSRLAWYIAAVVYRPVLFCCMPSLFGDAQQVREKQYPTKPPLENHLGKACGDNLACKHGS